MEKVYCNRLQGNLSVVNVMVGQNNSMEYSFVLTVSDTDPEIYQGE